MTYSFLMPYYNRPQLRFTLKSFQKFYSGRNDYEVILVEDMKTIEDPQQHKQLLDIIEEFSDMSIIYKENDRMAFSCCRPYNIAAGAATGEIFVITNPECMHSSNVLVGFDDEFKRNKNVYVICANRAMIHQGGEEFSFMMWYQHSQYNNRKLHFCSALTRENWFKAGGFNEDYIEGVAFEDDDWRERVRTLNIPIILRDDLITDHIEHPRNYLNNDLINKNRELYNRLWDRNR